MTDERQFQKSSMDSTVEAHPLYKVVAATAERCVAIASETIPAPDGPRHRTWEEIVHAIMRELLGQGGM